MLDVACGAGYPALAAARAVSPGGMVLATDISASMIAVARERAGTAGLQNVEFMEMDAEDLHVGSGWFDAVTNVYGLMFAADATRALAEARRVLTQNGRIAVVVWDSIDKSPYFSVMTSVAARMLDLPAPEPGAPGPFRFAMHGALESLLTRSGFSSVTVESCPAVFECQSAAEYVRIFADVAWKARITALPPARLQAFENAVADAALPYTENGLLRLTATSLCAAGLKT